MNCASLKIKRCQCFRSSVYWWNWWMVIIVTIPHVPMQLQETTFESIKPSLFNLVFLWIEYIWWYSFSKRAVWSMLQIMHTGKTIKSLTWCSSLQSTVAWKMNWPEILRWVSLIKTFEFLKMNPIEKVWFYCGICGKLIYTTNRMPVW